jgi:REP element-mobilizing transposase RayT
MDIVKACTGLTSFELRKPPSLWTRSYFASTPGTVSAHTIAQDVAAQKGA